MVCEPPGPRSRDASRRLAAAEAPGINTLYRGLPALVWDEAAGVNVRDLDGNVYLDFSSGFGVAAVGHRHPRVVEAVTAQAGRLLHGLGDVAAHPSRIALAERLVALAPVDEGRVHFAVSGADAVEVALKTAVLATGRPGILVFDPSYHGVTLGALAATSRPAFREPFAAHLHAHVTRLPFATPIEKVRRALEDEAVAAILVEPVVGREGVIVPPPGWLAGLAEAGREAGTLLAVDEIFTGFGRTGATFAVDVDGVRPDLLCLGKALAGGMPLAAVVGRRAPMEAWATPGEALHTGTFLAHPPSCAAAHAVLDVVEEEGLAAAARRLGEQVSARLSAWPSDHATVREVRGRGLLWGVELKTAATAVAIAGRARRSGLLVLAGGAQGRVVQVVPPLTISEGLLDLGLDLLEAALG